MFVHAANMIMLFLLHKIITLLSKIVLSYSDFIVVSVYAEFQTIFMLLGLFVINSIKRSFQLLLLFISPLMTLKFALFIIAFRISHSVLAWLLGVVAFHHITS